MAAAEDRQQLQHEAASLDAAVSALDGEVYPPCDGFGPAAGMEHACIDGDMHILNTLRLAAHESTPP